MTAAGTSFSTAMSALANDPAVIIRAPAAVNASAMPSAIKGSSSQMRIEQPAKLVLFMGRPLARQSANARGRRDHFRGRAVSRGVDQSSVRNKRDDRLLKALVA